MLAKRIIPCLDVREGKVVKGVQFKSHQIMGDIIELAQRYRNEGADELVFYDITASSEKRTVDLKWIEKTAKVLDIPFCVAGGIRSLEGARNILNAGADKISINTPAIENPNLIKELSSALGVQCVVIGIDSMQIDDDYWIYKYTGKEETIQGAKIKTIDWAKKVQDLGAGEIVLNCMKADGTKAGYDIKQLKKIRNCLQIPLIASGGAGKKEHFLNVFKESNVDGALAASIFHKNEVKIQELKKFLKDNNIEVRL